MKKIVQYSEFTFMQHNSEIRNKIINDLQTINIDKNWWDCKLLEFCNNIKQNSIIIIEPIDLGFDLTSQNQFISIPNNKIKFINICSKLLNDLELYKEKKIPMLFEYRDILEYTIVVNKEWLNGNTGYYSQNFKEIGSTNGKFNLIFNHKIKLRGKITQEVKKIETELLLFYNENYNYLINEFKILLNELNNMYYDLQTDEQVIKTIMNSDYKFDQFGSQI